MVSPQEWSSRYNVLKGEVISRRREGRAIPASQVSRMSSVATELENDLKSLQSNSMEYDISASEIARRVVVMENLKRQISLLAVSNSPLVGTGTSGTGGGAPSSAKTSRNSLSSTSSTNSSNRNSYISMNPLSSSDTSTSNKGLVQRQQDVIKMQDETILDIGKGVDRLHGQALVIGEEAKTHITIINQLDNNVDTATVALREEAHHADKINKATAMCSYYVCVAVEVVIVVLLLILWLGAGVKG